jgi:CubicO group peptidase (beta-lactamase class C family)
MYFMQAVIERIVNQPLDEFVAQNFYAPLGLQTLTFKPFEKIPLAQIAPTENDQTFRGRQIQGYVHDPGAAMYGGVAGHAGLFGTAQDLAVVLQLLLNKGSYGDVSLLKPETIAAFTKRQSKLSRRGWGWDKPEPEKGNDHEDRPQLQGLYEFLEGRLLPDGHGQDVTNPLLAA